MGREQRRHKRYDVGEVEGSLVQNLDARILNMSLTGMALETSALLKVGGNYYLRLPADGEPIRLKTDVRWARLVRTERRGDEVVPIYQAGIDFRDFLDDTAREVLKFIENHVVVELERRIFGRFKIANGEPVQLDSSHDFVVRKLSLSGMLVETETGAEVGNVYDLELRVSGSSIDARGRIAYADTEPGAASELHVLGIEFLDLTSENRRALEAVIEGQLE